MCIDTFVKAAEGSRNYRAFAEDMQRCGNAVDMCGLPQIKAESWIECLKKMTTFEIFQYVENRYIPGLLNPFDPKT